MESKIDKPKGKLKFDHITNNQTTHAIYFKIYLKDEVGVLWEHYSSSFLFDLKKVDAKKKKSKVGLLKDG